MNSALPVMSGSAADAAGASGAAGGGLSAAQWVQLLQGGSKLASVAQGQPREPMQMSVPEVAPYQGGGGGQQADIAALLRMLFPQEQSYGGAGDFGGGY
jgi:hypothetical protein